MAWTSKIHGVPWRAVCVGGCSVRVGAPYTAVSLVLFIGRGPKAELSPRTGFVLDEDIIHSKRKHKLQLIFSQSE